MDDWNRSGWLSLYHSRNGFELVVGWSAIVWTLAIRMNSAPMPLGNLQIVGVGLKNVTGFLEIVGCFGDCYLILEPCCTFIILACVCNGDSTCG